MSDKIVSKMAVCGRGLKKRYNTNCKYIVYESGIKVLQSYATVIAFCDKNDKWYINTRRFSVTTSKHLNHFYRHVLEEIPNVNAVKLADPDFVQTANSLGITL